MKLTQIQWYYKFGNLEDRTENPIDLWFNPTNPYSMRLTKSGWNHLCHHLDLIDYKFTLKDKISPKNLLQLERYIRFPYYVQTLRQIHIFDESTALMLTLNSNNLQKYLNDLESQT
jgi:hypothetical protein